MTTVRGKGGGGDLSVCGVRKKVLLEFATELGCSDNDMSQIRRSVDERMQKEMHKFHYIAPRGNKNSRLLATIMSLNMRSLNNKLTSANGIELWSYCKKQKVEAFCIPLAQDHRMWDSQAPSVQAAARTIMPNMQDSSISMQGTPGKNENTPVGGTALLCGGVLSKYNTAEITDHRGWCRFSGRIIQGKKHATETTGRHHLADRKHNKLTSVAIICVYAAVESTEFGSM